MQSDAAFILRHFELFKMFCTISMKYDTDTISIMGQHVRTSPDQTIRNRLRQSSVLNIQYVDYDQTRNSITDRAESD